MSRTLVASVHSLTLAVALGPAASAYAATVDAPARASLQLSPAEATPVPADYDGDGRDDMALKGSDGVWYIDLAANGFGGVWDLAYTGYGFSNAVAVPADYDGDGIDDLATKDAMGDWGIDYSTTGFGNWDILLSGYGDDASIPVPADYDGDGKADLSVKDSAGVWYLNYSADGFASGWNVQYNGYGDAASLPVPEDYDGDGKADLSVKNDVGCWHIDYASNGFGGWNEIRCGYGNNSGVPAPADYDGDGKADLSIKGTDGNWYIDYAANGFVGWNAIYGGRGPASSLPAPGDYDGDGLTDLAVYSTVDGTWYIDYAANGIAFWDTWVDNGARTVVDTTRPYIVSTTIYGEGNVPVALLTVGVRYVVDVVIHRGSGSDNAAGVEINEILDVPESLKLVNRFGSTYSADISNGGSETQTHRRYALTPTAAGSFPLGFQLRSAPPYYGGQIFHYDYGIRVNVDPPAQTALTGRVTRRVKNAAGVFVSGTPIVGAVVTLVKPGAYVTTTDIDGRWRIPVTASNMSVRITMSGYSEMNIVNVSVPSSGLFVNTQMEQAFPSLPSNIKYKTYVDYSGSRALVHVVELTRAATSARIGRSYFDPAGLCNAACQGFSQCPAFDLLHDMGESLNAMVIMNGTWWNICNGNPIGYLYSGSGTENSEVWCDNRFGSTTDCSGSNLYYAEGGTTPLYPAGTAPMLTISGYNATQRFAIVESNDNFLESPSTQWSQTPYPIWDVWPHDGQSDVAYAVQIPNPPLLRSGAVIAGGHFQYDSYGNYDYAFARTSVGVGPDNEFYMVIVDGEGVHGGNGMTGNQLGHFYRDVLGATEAMGLDSGLSTEMLIRTSGGLYRVNTITGEDAQIQLNPYTQVLSLAAGAIGSVGYYIALTQDATGIPEVGPVANFAVQVRSSVGSSQFEFALTMPEPAAAELVLYDARGREVAVAFRGPLTAGSHVMRWMGADAGGVPVAAGVYFYRFRAGDRRATGSVVVVE